MYTNLIIFFNNFFVKKYCNRIADLINQVAILLLILELISFSLFFLPFSEMNHIFQALKGPSDAHFPQVDMML